MKWLTSATLLTLLLIPQITLARVASELEWHDVDDEPKRTLHVCYHRSLNEQWRGWAGLAMQEWNDHTEETGWDFEVVPFTRDRCQIFLIARDISESVYGGSTFEPIDVLEGQKERMDGRLNGAVVTIDTHLEQTSRFLQEAEDSEDGSHDGWSVLEEEGTRDPISAMLHQLSRAVRLVSDDKYVVSADEDLADPKIPGEHYHQLSASDLRQAAEANEADQRIQTGSVGVAAEEHVELGGLLMSFPAYTFGYVYRDYEFSYADATATAPSILSTPNNTSHVFSSFGFFSEDVIQRGIETSFTYSEEDLAPSTSALLDAEGYYTPGLLEESLKLVRFEKSSWDLTPLEIEDNPSEWVEVEDVEIDFEANRVSFVLDEAGYYGLVASPDPEQPAQDIGFVRIINGELYNEDELARRLKTQQLISAILEQLPAFGLGTVFGGLLMWLGRPRKKKEKKLLPTLVESDSQSVSDVE